MAAIFGSIDVNKLTSTELEAYLSIINNVELFAETFMVNPKTGEPMALNYVQRKMLFTDSLLNAIRVHRRAGKSFGLVIYAIWYALTHKASQILIICPDKDKVLALFELIDQFVDVSPGFKSCLIRSSNSNPIVRKFSNNSTIQGFTTGARTKGAAEALRGQAADVVIIDEGAFLDNDDWPAIEPIIFGDAKRIGKVICFVSSTPTAERGRYWEMCTKLKGWRKVHVPITDNPDFTDEQRQHIKDSTNEFTYKQEFLAEFPDVGEGVYKRSYIDRAKRNYSFYDLADIYYRPPEAIRTIGVDWDKYQAGPNIVVIELDKEAQKYKIVYHEEIPRSEYCLTLAVDRIIQLNAQLNPQWIYVDRGYGEVQCELLHKYGDENPYTGLKDKVVGISFSDSVVVNDPAIGQSIKKRIKPIMVNITVKWFEDDAIAYPASFEKFTEQLQDFKVLGTTDNAVKYSTKNEHIIDAFCLACYAMHKNYADPFKFETATRSFLLPSPEPVSAKVKQAYGIVKDTPIGRTDFSRRHLPKLDFAGKGSVGSNPLRKSF